MLRDLMRFLRFSDSEREVLWLSRDLALGRPASDAGWRALRASGVVAVLEVGAKCDGAGDRIRRLGMRYLRLPVDRTGLPEARELHIVTSWIRQRAAEDGSVLIFDASDRGNDLLVACAVLVKDGVDPEKAQSQIEAMSLAALEPAQVTLLRQFVAQRALAATRG